MEKLPMVTSQTPNNYFISKSKIVSFSNLNLVLKSLSHYVKARQLQLNN
jgi:hypothetical protein